MSDQYRDLLENRLEAIKVTDVILAALQAAFASDKLVDGGNPYRFIRDDPANSRVWVCDPDSRVEFSETDGNRLIVMVSRGDYVPSDLHLHNRGDGGWDGVEELYDHATTMVFVQCEAGNKTSSEVLASICYNILKLFRRELMQQYDILNIKFHAISPATANSDVPGNPWITNVSLRLETQERFRMTEIANHLNHLLVNAEMAANVKRQIIYLDATPPAAP